MILGVTGHGHHLDLPVLQKKFHLQLLGILHEGSKGAFIFKEL